MTNRPRNAYCSFCRKSYQDVGPLVEGPDEVYICGECVELCQSIIEQEKRRRGASAEGHSLPALQKIQAKLTRYVSGQAAATNALAAAAHDHYQQVSQGGPPTRKALLLIGPSCSSRLFVARALAHFFNVPFAHGKAEAAATAEFATTPLFKLLHAADFDMEVARRGIVYLDGVDEQTAQAPVLELLGGKVSDPLPPDLRFDSSHILYLCGGSFPRLAEVAARRGRHPEQPVTGEELKALGVDPELVSKFSVVVTLAPLDDDTLSRIVPLVDLERLVERDA